MWAIHTSAADGLTDSHDRTEIYLTDLEAKSRYHEVRDFDRYFRDNGGTTTRRDSW